MNLDLITSIELTVSAAIVVAAVSLSIGHSRSSRLGIAAALGTWFITVAGLAAEQSLGPENPLGIAALGLAVGLPMLGLAAWIVLNSQARDRLRETPVTVWVAVNTVRVLGVSFLFLSAQERVAPTFAAIAGWGDIAVGVLALPLAWYGAVRGREARRAIWAWNLVGLLDLVTAVGLGVASSPGVLRLIVESVDSSVMTTLPWLLIPGFLVPLLASTHLAIFWKLNLKNGGIDRTCVAAS